MENYKIKKKKTNSKMTHINSTLSAVTLNVNILKTPKQTRD